MKNIEELNATIEELEKRIKAISSAGATLAQIIAVRDSLEQVKVCLNNLTTAIKDEESDASVAQLTALEQRVATAETDITTLQTDLTSTQDDLETVWNNLASTNSVVGEHTTTLTNLQTAQTNLQTTQTNQASTITTNTTDISNLKTRMTTAEANIGALTNGIDVGTLEDRVSSLEEKKYYTISVFLRKKIDEEIISEINFNLISNGPLNSYSEIVTNFPTNYNLSVNGFIEEKIIYSVYKNSESTLAFLTMKNNNVNNTISLKRSENLYLSKNETGWDYFIKPTQLL